MITVARCPHCAIPLRSLGGDVWHCLWCGRELHQPRSTITAADVASATARYVANGGIITPLPYAGDVIPESLHDDDFFRLQRLFGPSFGTARGNGRAGGHAGRGDPAHRGGRRRSHG